jgi:hypothetical protein
MATTDKERESSTDANEPAADAGRSGGLRQSAGEAFEAARERTAAAYGTARERASSAYASTREQAAQQIDANPFGLLIGGFAVGALIAGLLPRTQREDRALGTIGGRINETARDALSAARDAGRDKLDELGLNRDGLGERLSEFASSAGAAIRNARRGGD